MVAAHARVGATHCLTCVVAFWIMWKCTLLCTCMVAERISSTLSIITYPSWVIWWEILNFMITAHVRVGATPCLTCVVAFWIMWKCTIIMYMHVVADMISPTPSIITYPTWVIWIEFSDLLVVARARVGTTLCLTCVVAFWIMWKCTIINYMHD